ncbi:glycoside hydrolase [Staphylotrichum tortipilum]|uniref:Endo-chitosanase n=1 Tax=Staphylotrichum tortipilum TaxID=2831512 RepID=A0AAN6RVR3_9PEZI|nr:glycoside hydrolase [Staphylotrichum longicolle]
MSPETVSFSLYLLAIIGLVLSLVQLGAALDLPPNLREFYDGVRAKRQCTNQLAKGFYSNESGPNTFSYCGSHLHSSGILYIQGRNGALANMDVDCDGLLGGPADDGRCRLALSPDYQNTTAFQSILASYNRGITDLNPYVHSYVVFGNTPGIGTEAWSSYDPTTHGMRPLSLMAVVCPDYRLVYGVWGDTNGNDGQRPMVGEASLSLATYCSGSPINGNSGIDEDAVLYIGFTGEEAVPGPDGADWAATSPDAFQRSLSTLGDRLVQRVQYQNGASSEARPHRTADAARLVVVVFIVVTILL